ncbi:MAG: glycosyl hydrolase, partial [Bacteroidota bacterium]
MQATKRLLLGGLCLLLALPLVQAQRKKKSKTPPPPPPTLQYEAELYSGLNFREVGPYRGGRSCAVTGVPGQPLLFYFGSTGGGIWRTRDGGQTWQNISDGYFGGSIGAIAVSESDPNVIYVGGGEKTVRGNVSYGYGVWKSVDAGKTWQQMGLETSRHIGRIRVHPDNPDRVYAAVMGDLYQSTAERGVYRSDDGGQNWEKILFANEDAGAVDLTFDPSNPRI